MAFVSLGNVNDGQVKLNYSSNPADTGSYFGFSLAENVETVLTLPPFPDVSSVTRWPGNIPEADRVLSSVFDGNHLIENDVYLQPHWFRIQFMYDNSSNSVDNQMAVSLRNPVSGFEIGVSVGLLRGASGINEGVEIKTYADEFSLPSFGIGNGYELVMIATESISVVMKSITRESVFVQNDARRP